MRVCVFGLWHLGSVIAACLASIGYNVKAVDDDTDLLGDLSCGVPPVNEPGLNDLIKRGVKEGCLEFEKAGTDSFSNADIVWVTFDTPVDDNDVADTEFILDQVRGRMKFFCPGALVIISSQLPVGSTKQLENFSKTHCPELNLSFCYCPENLRLGKAIETFMQADRFIVGIRNEADEAKARFLFQQICGNVIFMSVESAEMTKHAINGFLATSVAFANELAMLCEFVGANAKEVEIGLKSEARIGPRSYLAPGPAYSGGTLARDIEFLKMLGVRNGHQLSLVSSVGTSNDDHKAWARRRLISHFGSINGLVIGVWGLTYKPGTNTLRRSGSLELCEWLMEKGAELAVFDPAFLQMPDGWRIKAQRFDTAEKVLAVCDALVIATPWPQFKDINFEHSRKKDAELVVFDPSFHLNWEQRQHIDAYYAVGVFERLGHI